MKAHKPVFPPKDQEAYAGQGNQKVGQDPERATPRLTRAVQSPRLPFFGHAAAVLPSPTASIRLAEGADSHPDAYGRLTPTMPDCSLRREPTSVPQENPSDRLKPDRGVGRKGRAACSRFRSPKRSRPQRAIRKLPIP